MRTIYLFLAYIIFFGSCSKSDDPQPMDPPFSNVIQFDQIEVGQKSYYLLFQIENFWENINFSYTGDTLVAEVTEKKSDRMFSVKEYFLHPSKELESLIWGGADQVTNEWLFENDSLKIANNQSEWVNTILTFDKESLPIHHIEEHRVQFSGWKLDVPYYGIDGEFYIIDYTLLGHRYQHLNAILDHSGMQVDGPGYTFVYHSESGFVKTAIYSPWTGGGFGFDLIR